MINSPPPIVPTPASIVTDLRGCRVIVGTPGVGFRLDLRADDAVTNGGRTFVPVLTEQDYYRAELEQVEVFAPLVPIERVWVERIGTEADRISHSIGPLDAPIERTAVPALASTYVLGRRVVEAVPDGFVRDLRAVTDVYNGGSGAAVRICGEAEWYRWAMSGSSPSIVEVSAQDLWIE